MDDPQPVSISKAQIPAKAETPLHRKVHLVLRFTPVAVVVAVVALLIHSGVLSHLSLRELRLRSSPTATAAGYIRTEAGLRSLWRRSHRDRKLSVGSHTGFLLTRR